MVGGAGEGHRAAWAQQLQGEEITRQPGWQYVGKEDTLDVPGCSEQYVCFKHSTWMEIDAQDG